MDRQVVEMRLRSVMQAQSSLRLPNLGIATMANSTEGMSVDLLQPISRWFLRQETLKAANQIILVDFHHQLPLTSVWGAGLGDSKVIIVRLPARRARSSRSQVWRRCPCGTRGRRRHSYRR